MNKKMETPSFLLCSALFCTIPLLITASSQSLYTNSRWIVAEDGELVKLASVNWVSPLEPLLAEGLSKQPVDVISKRIKSMGFNCVRFTWPILLVTNNSLASLTVRQSFLNLGLLESISGIQSNNPSIIDLPLIQAYQWVVGKMGEEDVMVILDTHMTKPGWCCSNSDGNGFFGDRDIDPELRVEGLTIVPWSEQCGGDEPDE